MIELFIKTLIEELGATGLLVVGLYFILYRPLNSISHHVHKINDDLTAMLKLMKELSHADKEE